VIASEIEPISRRGIRRGQQQATAIQPPRAMEDGTDDVLVLFLFAPAPKSKNSPIRSSPSVVTRKCRKSAFWIGKTTDGYIRINSVSFMLVIMKK
jgi:hypothetical protein